MKRLLDIGLAGLGLLLAGPFLLLLMGLIWLEDRHSPLYRARRVGKGGKPFVMVKLRSMVVNADEAGGVSTSADDRRITRMGALVRRCKMDELMQLWNVLRGDMSLVGPRPQVEAEVARYTKAERGLLEAVPGVTDMASIVFADEGEILAAHEDADLAYNQLIRPWKSRLGLLYVQRRKWWIDVRLIFLTALALGWRRAALARVSRMVAALGGDEALVAVAGRLLELKAHPPPGSESIVTVGCETVL